MLLFMYSCSTAKDALVGKKRSEQGDEFLIDKKNPLVMPPDFDKLPKPGEANIKSTKDIATDQSNIKSLLKKNSDGEIISSNDESTSIESSILKKIK